MMTTPTWYTTLIETLTAGERPDDVAIAGARIDYIINGERHRGNMLARHSRYDTSDPDHPILWIRPIVGGGPGFDLYDCRTQGLPAHTVRLDDGAIWFDAADGHAIITITTDPDDVRIIDYWDAYIVSLPDDEIDDLNQLYA